MSLESKDIQLLGDIVGAKIEGRFDAFQASLSNTEQMTHITKEQVNHLVTTIEVHKEALCDIKESIKDLKEAREQDIYNLNKKVEECEQDILDKLDKEYIRKPADELLRQEIEASTLKLVDKKQLEFKEQIEHTLDRRLSFIKWVVGLVGSIGVALTYLIEHIK